MSCIITDESMLTSLCKDAHPEEVSSILKKLRSALLFEPNGIGLSAPQIGINKRVAIVKKGDEEICLINPNIIDGQGSIHYLEGCLSFPGKSFTTTRFTDFTLVNHTQLSDSVLICDHYCYHIDEDDKVPNNDGVIGIAIQHEVDHLNGKLVSRFKTQQVRSTKVGRNEPCPCGSGKKYKKCCGR